MIRARPLLLALAAALALSGCAAIETVRRASAESDSYELQPLPPSQAAAGTGGAALLVEIPTATGAIASDRVAIKPDARLVQYLPRARWVDSAEEHVQLLLVRSLRGAGRFGLVTGALVGPSPDYTLLTDLHAFQAELDGTGAAPVLVRVGMTMTLTAETGEILGSRRIERTATTAGTEAGDIVAAFDAATGAFLADAVPWIVATSR